MTGETFFVEGTSAVTFRGGSWGGYSTPGEADSRDAHQRSGGTDLHRRQARHRHLRRRLLPRRLLGRPRLGMGSLVPDCFEINGYVAAVTVPATAVSSAALPRSQIDPNRYATFEKNVYSSATRAGTGSRSQAQESFRALRKRDLPSQHLPSIEPGGEDLADGSIRTELRSSSPCAGVRRIRQPVRRSTRPANEKSPLSGGRYHTKWQHNLFLTGSCGARRSPSATASGTWASWRTDAPRRDRHCTLPRADWPRASSHGGWRARTLPVLRAAAGTLGQSASS